MSKLVETAKTLTANLAANMAKTLVSTVASAIADVTVETTTTAKKSRSGRTTTATSKTRVILPEKKEKQKEFVDFLKPEGWEIHHTVIDPNGRYEEWELIDLDELKVKRTVHDHGIVYTDPFPMILSNWKDMVETNFRLNRNYIAAQYLYPSCKDEVPVFKLEEFETRFVELVLQHQYSAKAQEIIKFVNRYISEMNSMIATLKLAKDARLENEKLREDLMTLRCMKTTTVLHADSLSEELEELREERDRLLKEQEDFIESSRKRLNEIQARSAERDAELENLRVERDQLFMELEHLRDRLDSFENDDICEEDTPHGRYLMEKEEADCPLEDD